MNHESEQHQPAREPEHNTYEYLAELAEKAPNQQARMTLLNAFLVHGTAFGIYLRLDEVDPYAEDILESFKANFGGAYESKRHLMDQTLNDLGLRQELDDFMNDHMELTGLLTFDYDTLWELLQDRWEIIELGGVLYVFER